MNYKIVDIEGIGPAYAEKMEAAGIKTADMLLEKGATPKGRQAIAEATGISQKLITTWVNHADLMRIDGVGPQYAELLEASGVDTVVELSHRRADNLAKKMAEVNETRRLTGRTPTETEMARMIEQAATMPRVVTY